MLKNPNIKPAEETQFEGYIALHGADLELVEMALRHYVTILGERRSALNSFASTWTETRKRSTAALVEMRNATCRDQKRAHELADHMMVAQDY